MTFFSRNRSIQFSCFLRWEWDGSGWLGVILYHRKPTVGRTFFFLPFPTMVLSIHFLNFFLHMVMFVKGVLSHSRIFYSYVDVTITDGLQIFFIPTRHSWQLSSEVSLPCLINLDTGYPIIWPSVSTIDAPNCFLAFSGGALTACFYDFCRDQGSNSDHPYARRTQYHGGCTC